MIKRAIFLLLCFMSSAAFAVTITEKNGVFTIRNQSYSITYSRGSAWGGVVQVKGGSCMLIPYLWLDTELEKYSERKNPKPVMVNRRKLSVSAKIKENTETKAVLELSFKFNGGTFTETITFDDTPVIRYDVDIDHQVRLHLHSLKLLINSHSKDAVFLPDNKQVPGYPVYGNVVSGKTWRGFWDPKWNICAIMGITDDRNLAGIEYGMNGKKDGKAVDHAEVSTTSVPLAQKGKSGRQKLSYTVIVSSQKDVAVKTAGELYGKKDSPYIFAYDTEKLIVRPGQGNSLLVQLRNPGKAQEVTLKTSLIYSLNSEKIIDTRKVKLAADEIRDMKISCKLPKEAQRGMLFRTELLDASGKKLDTAQEFFSVTNFAPRDASFGVTNADILYLEGQIEAQTGGFKRRYVGGFEYYCWAKSVIGALAPEEDSWIPNTEHSVDKVLTKQFVKKMIAHSQSQGVGVYSWITGLWDYHYAFRYPERMQYNKDGQPNIYSGKYYPDGRRRAVVKPHMFTPERAAEWGREMADSVDMFGWDGCRWDWSFCPNLLSDPLFMGDHADDWYDWKGVPSSKLFPDPDQTSVDCLKAWRKAVEERHPTFIYGTNYGSRPVLMKMNPKYKVESARNALTLFEDMAAYSKKEWSTFQLWGEELVRRIDQIRPYGAAPAVGFMSGLPPNSVSHNLARYTTIACGIKWWDSNIISIDMLTDQVRNRFLLRYAEWLYHKDFLHPEKLSVKIAGQDKILYETFVRERKVKGGREIILPVLNLPEDNGYICQYHDIPPVKKNLEVSVDLKKGETIGTVWLMTPQQPEKAVALDCKNGKFRIPELVDFCTVLIQIKGE